MSDQPAATSASQVVDVWRTTANQARVASLLVGVGALGVLIVARWLDPSGSGHSTHLQLGLQPCTFLAVTGWPCPMCGATTTFALMADGRVLQGLWNQPFAAFLFLADAVVAGISLADAAWPRGRWRRIGDALRPHEPQLAVAFVTAMMLGWIWKIAMMRF